MLDIEKKKELIEELISEMEGLAVKSETPKGFMASIKTAKIDPAIEKEAAIEGEYPISEKAEKEMGTEAIGEDMKDIAGKSEDMDEEELKKLLQEYMALQK